MEQYIDLMANLGPAGITVLVVVVLLFVGVVVRQVMSMKRSTRKSEKLVAPADPHEVPGEVETPPQKEAILGTGNLRCMAFCADGIHFTRIPKPRGNIFIADTSMPENGSIYIVKESDDGTVEPYDPRLEPVVSEGTPQHAYFATHWDIVSEVFCYTKEWWKSAPMWLAIGMLIVVGISVLAVLG